MNTSLLELSSKKKTFSALHNNGQKKPGIDYCFLDSFYIDASLSLPSEIRAADGKVYTAVYDNFHLPQPWKDQKIKAIGSFQKHTDGHFVIIRNHSSSF